MYIVMQLEFFSDILICKLYQQIDLERINKSHCNVSTNEVVRLCYSQ